MGRHTLLATPPCLVPQTCLENTSASKEDVPIACHNLPYIFPLPNCPCFHLNQSTASNLASRYWKQIHQGKPRRSRCRHIVFSQFSFSPADNISVIEMGASTCSGYEATVSLKRRLTFNWQSMGVVMCENASSLAPCELFKCIQSQLVKGFTEPIKILWPNHDGNRCSSFRLSEGISEVVPAKSVFRKVSFYLHSDNSKSNCNW